MVAVAEGPGADTAERTHAPEFGPWLAQASILVVDDEPGMRNFLVKTLGPRCKVIAEAATGSISRVNAHVASASQRPISPNSRLPAAAAIPTRVKTSSAV